MKQEDYLLFEYHHPIHLFSLQNNPTSNVAVQNNPKSNVTKSSVTEVTRVTTSFPAFAFFFLQIGHHHHPTSPANGLTINTDTDTLTTTFFPGVAMHSFPTPLFSHTPTFLKPTHRPKPPLLISISLHSLTSSEEAKPITFSAQNSHQHHDPGFLLPPPLWTATEIAQAVNGRIAKWGPPGTISTDTRTLVSNQWFFAISGENFDAHDFINQELSRKGCIGVIGNRVSENWDKGFVRTNRDSVVSLMRMGSYARSRFSGEVVGVTGSAGKTTTKAMIALALGGFGKKVYESFGNRNNEIGVALSLIGIPGNARIAVLEMGMDSKGEILELARIARPSVRVILNVGDSHLVNFGSLEEIAMAKGEILVEAKPGDVCVLNADDPLVMSLPLPYGVKKVLFGRSVGCDVRLVAAESADGGRALRVVLEKNGKRVILRIPSPGLHLALNACAATAVATHLGVPLTQVGRSLSTFCPVHMRSELEVAKNGITIVNDTYNANPTSTKAAINLLNGIECGGKRVSVLGDMLELGSNEIKFHEMILEHCCNARIDLIGLVGTRFLTAAKNLKLVEHRKVVVAHDAKTLALEILKRIDCEDVVLVKGSRGMEMETVVNVLKEMEIQS